jgi:hypothetical protein
MAFEILTRSRPRRNVDGSFELGGRSFKQWILDMPDVPETLAELVEQMIARDPDERPSLTAVRAVIKRLRAPTSPATSHPALRLPGTPATGTKLGVAPAPVVATRPHPVTAARPPRSSRRWLVVGIAAALAVAAALAIHFL